MGFAGSALLASMADLRGWPRLTGGWSRRLNRFLRRFQTLSVPTAFAVGLVLGHLLWQ
jgi:hypothetical protein